MSRTAYVKHRSENGLPGATYPAVKRAIDEGRITVDAQGRIPDPVVADREWEANSRARPAVNAIDYQTARAAREHYNAELARLSFEEKQGQLIDAKAAHDEAFAIGRRVRDRLLAIPARIGPVFASMEEPRAITQHLEAELRAALEGMAGANDDDAEA